MKIFFTGISGLLASNLAWYFRERAEVSGVFNNHPVAMPGVAAFALNLEDYPATRAALSRLNPDVVVHCAGRTDVDNQEGDPEGSWRANVLTTRVLLDALRDHPARFVYISSESIYPGIKGPYRETDPAQPRNEYGRTKLAGEQLTAARPGSLTLRTNIFGWNIRNKQHLAEWFLHNLQQHQPVSGFTDALFSPLYTRHFAELLERSLAAGLSGVFNLASQDAMSKHAFGRCLAELFQLNPELVQAKTLRQAALRAPRGNDLRLDVSKLQAALPHRPLPTMAAGLQAFHQDWQNGLPGQIKAGLKSTIAGLSVQVKRHNIPYGNQFIDATDLAAVATVLRSRNLTQGPTIDNFETAIAKTVQARFAVAVNSGTSALHLACLASGVGPGDEVITSPITFVASANCAAYCGATPVFADIDPQTQNIDPQALAQKITPRTRAVIPVHYAGQSCDMARIQAIVQAHEKKLGRKIAIIEDACHALGSRYRQQPVGICRHSDMTIFSFHPVKQITTGEGGLITTQSPDLEQTLRRLRSHGIRRIPKAEEPGPWYYEQVDLGYNYRTTDIQCALGIAQLNKLEWFQKRRRAIVERYNAAFQNQPFLTIPQEMADCDSNYHLYVLRFDFPALGMTRTEVMRALKQHHIGTQVHYIPVYYHPFYQKRFGMKKGACPQAEAFYDTCLSLPLFPGLSATEMETVIHRVLELVHSPGTKK